MNIRQTIFLIITSICLFGLSLSVLASQISGDKVNIAYISDLNLYNTPSENQTVKHVLEKRIGVQVYESQVIFQEIIKYINQKLEPDIVIFGGNNIVDSKRTENLWQLFLDMISELKSDVFINLGPNELKNYNTDELLYSLNTFGHQKNNLWYSQKIKNYLFIGLDSLSLFNNPKLSQEQLNWFVFTLSQNMKTPSIVSLYHPLLDSKGNVLNNPMVKNLINIISANPQIKLVIFGGEYFNRVHLLKGCIFVNAPSPVVYPCSFKSIELSSNRIKIKTINIPLKGIIKKALKSAQGAEYFKSKASPAALKSYLLGEKQDLRFEYDFPPNPI